MADRLLPHRERRRAREAATAVAAEVARVGAELGLSRFGAAMLLGVTAPHREREPERKIPLRSNGTPPIGEIVVQLLPGSRVRIGSSCMGRFDSAYAPMADGFLGAELERLLGELRARLAGTSPR